VQEEVSLYSYTGGEFCVRTLNPTVSLNLPGVHGWQLMPS